MYRNTVLGRSLMQQSVSGRVGVRVPDLDVPSQPLPDAALLRSSIALPELSELDLVRYFTHLSQANFSVDTNFYPLGSCTMKYNPKINDELAGLASFASLHPLQDPETAQGALTLLSHLQDYLCEITGLAGCSLSTLAGAHGELAGVLITKAFHEMNGEGHRDLMLIPTSAHGTNPASASMAGYRVQEIPSNARGDMDLDALRLAAKPDLAGLMITLPSTLGLFDPSIAEICDVVHAAGGVVYGDGANMNALLGQVKLGALGFDIVHLNLHKTMSTPHGGGGPGAGPICVTSPLLPFLPTPIIKHENDANPPYQVSTPSQSIGPIGSFHGNFGVLLRAYAYIRALGADGLRQVSEDAVLSANYIKANLQNTYTLAYDRPCMHEVVFSARAQKVYSVRAIDIAKRLIDYGIHPPTMYFPLIVDEALMIEPTETESKETLDVFIAAMEEIAREVTTTPEIVRGAPHSTPIGRLDEALAARKPDLRWRP
jgi:glycine dehydrogenase subunit 2